MAYRYLKTFALLTACSVPALAQQLPTNIQARPQGWYLGPSVAALQTQRFESSNGILQSAANQPQPAVGLRLGYSHSPGLALETGIHVFPNSSGFLVNSEQLGIPRTYKSSQVYLPVAVVLRVWQPMPRLAVQAVVGGGLSLRMGPGLSSFIDTARYYSASSGLWDGKLLVSKQGTTNQLSYAAEVGLRAEWQAFQLVAIGAEVKDLLALGTVENSSVFVTDAASRTVLATAQLGAHRHTLWAGVNARFFIHTGTKYRYRPQE